jgi:hypothetical protein
MVSVGAQVNSKEELLARQEASDQWSYYQGKAVRRYPSEVACDGLAASGAEAASKRYEANIERYQKENEQIMEKAREYEKESAGRGRQALRLGMGEVFLEVALVAGPGQFHHRRSHRRHDVFRALRDGRLPRSSRYRVSGPSAPASPGYLLPPVVRVS